MFNVVSGALPGTVNARLAARSAPRAKEDFSQQLKSVLQDTSRERGIAGLVPKASQPSNTAKACDDISSQRQSLAAPAQAAVPEVIYETHAGWNAQWYASSDMAAWLAGRVGGEVGTHVAENWSSLSTPVYPAPPPQNTIRIGDKEVNAGCLAMYFEPGRFSQPDLEAAAALYREGIVNDYVRQHWSGLMGAAAPSS
jgi:hypothetical protein